MATTTPNFGWPVPTSTDLVKDGATAIEALGDGIDTSLVDLKGGTTGQVLSKTTGADMDFTWVTTDDVNAIQNAIVDAKGDLIAASANDTPARLAVGNNGETLVADSSATTGLRWQGDYAAGKNKIINGDFGIWQRGTSIAAGANANVFGPDRYYVIRNGSGATYTISQQTFTPGTAPVAGYEGTFYCRLNQSVAGSGSSFSQFIQKIEDVRTFAGQSVTLSFWAKANSTIASTTVDLAQNFGSGGSGTVVTSGTVTNIDTSWQRFSVTLAVPSISGKTIGTSSSLDFRINLPLNTTFTVELWGVQVEYGSVATAFQTASGSIAGELALAQRYYFRSTPGGAYSGYGLGSAFSTTQTSLIVNLPVEMRSTLTIDYGNLAVGDGVAATVLTALAIQYQSKTSPTLVSTVASGLTQYRPYQLQNNNNAAGYLALSSEL
jgi:hypothetical protein